MILENLPGERVQFNLPFNAVGIFQLDFIDILAVGLVQVGIQQCRAGMQGQGCSLQLIEGDNSNSAGPAE